MHRPGMLLIGLLPLLWATANAADLSQGQRLHDSLCTSCHSKRYGGDGTEMYLRADRKIHDRAALDKRVAFCNKMTGAGLSPEDEKNISAYLEQRYYKFAP
jgi:mono/diheme cytochrome c family protein